MPKETRVATNACRRLLRKFTFSRMALAITVASSPQLYAASFSTDDFTDDFKINIDSTLTYGAQWRIEDRDPNISKGSSGLPGERPLDNLSTVIDNAFVINSNDGNNSFDKGSMTANRISLLTEADFNVGEFGLFVRGKIWYDAIYSSNDNDMSEESYHSFNGNPRFGNNGGNNADRGKFVPDAKDYMSANATFLDAFVYGSFPIGERSLNLRVGRQVISWGESMLSGGGLAMTIAHVDAQIRSTPGLEIKELFLPNGAILAQFDMTDTLSVQAFYQYEWQPSIIDPAGSYSSQFDGLGDGAGTFMFVTGEEQSVFDKDVSYELVNGRRIANVARNQPLVDLLPGPGCPTNDNCELLIMHEYATIEPSDQGQFGFGLNYVLDNGDELGLYFVNYHEKNPNFIIPLDVVDAMAPVINFFALAATPSIPPANDPTCSLPNDPADPNDNGCWSLEQWAEQLVFEISSDQPATAALLAALNLSGTTVQGNFVQEGRVFDGPLDLGPNLSTEQLVILLKFLGAVPAEGGGGTLSDIMNQMGVILLPRTGELPINLATPGTANNPCKYYCGQGLQPTVGKMLSIYGIGMDDWVDSMDYRVKYFDNIRTWGMTYSTVLGVANVAAEITYRENVPVMRGNVARTPDRNEVWHMHLNTIMVYEPTFMWDFATLVAEAVTWHIPGRKNFNQFDQANPERLAVQNTTFGTGVGAMFMMEWRSVWEGVDLVMPTFVNYGLDGAMIFTGYANHQGIFATGLTAKFLESMEAGLTVGINFGEKDDIFQILTHDRDSVSLSFKYGF